MNRHDRRKAKKIPIGLHTDRALRIDGSGKKIDVSNAKTHVETEGDITYLVADGSASRSASSRSPKRPASGSRSRRAGKCLTPAITS
jgi:hypothetical protein